METVQTLFTLLLIASTQLLLTTWLNSWESISQPASFAYLLILPFSVFQLYAHTHLVKGHFCMLCQQSGTLTKSGHPTPSHPSNHHLKLIFFSRPTDCVCVCVCVYGEGGREKENQWSITKDKIFFPPLILFHVMGLVLRRRNGTEKITLLLLLPVTPLSVTWTMFKSHSNVKQF